MLSNKLFATASRNARFVKKATFAPKAVRGFSTWEEFIKKINSGAAQKLEKPSELPIFGQTNDPLFKEGRRFLKALEDEGVKAIELTTQRMNELVKSNPKIAESYNEFLYHVEAAKKRSNRNTIESKQPVRVTVTGASGQIGYSLLFRIASGEMLGKDQPVILQLLELPQAVKPLEGVAMELHDCAFPLLRGVVTTSEVKQAFEGSDYALLVGAKPRSKGMERGDLLKENAKIFQEQGKALNDAANKTVKVVVVGNPANTNAMIASHFAPSIPTSQITAMTKLDHNRGLAQLAMKTGSRVSHIEKFCIWGNHSATQYPDISNCQINGKWAKDLIKDDKWVKETFIPTVQQRGAAIIAARGSSSAASAASSAIDHMREWALGTDGQWTSMAVCSDGSYGVDKGLWYSYPVVCDHGKYTIVGNVPVDEFSASKMEATRKELLSEKEAVSALLK